MTFWKQDKIGTPLLSLACLLCISNVCMYHFYAIPAFPTLEISVLISSGYSQLAQLDVNLYGRSFFRRDRLVLGLGSSGI